MQTVTIDPLRWQAAPSRVILAANGSKPAVRLQVTAPRDVAGMAAGRPVEELPRILAILGPAHHLVGAQALDRLFGVEPPPPAMNMRRALLETLFFSEHLQKIYFLLTAWEHPLQGLRQAGRGAAASPVPGALPDEIMHALALAQEGVVIIGGRSAHPLTAIAGGVSRYLKEDAYQRLAAIAEQCLQAVRRIAAALRTALLSAGRPLATWREIGVPLAHAALAPPSADGMAGDVVVRNAGGETHARFAVEEIGSNISVHREPWTYQPFACLQADGWPGLSSGPPQGLFFVGPLARLNDGRPLGTPAAEEERQRLIAEIGPFPHYSVAAAFWALLVEALQAAERMTALYQKEKLIGPSIRSVPARMGSLGTAALESPEGLIFHEYRVDRDGIVTELKVLDTTTANNALRCLIAQRIAESGAEPRHRLQEIKTRMEIGLLPF
jgi:F420-non-reducing hydrogenase large subunit